MWAHARFICTRAETVRSKALGAQASRLLRPVCDRRQALRRQTGRQRPDHAGLFLRFASARDEFPCKQTVRAPDQCRLLSVALTVVSVITYDRINVNMTEKQSLYCAFKAKAETVKAEVSRFASRGEAFDFLSAVLRRENAGGSSASAVVAAGSWLREPDRRLLGALPGVTLDVTRERAAGARVGVSRMDWALADTGTLAQDATEVAQRLVSTLPAIHIALVPTAGLLPDLPALLTIAAPRAIAYLALISGPSRTADIERVLTIGAHGPERLLILFIDDFE